MQKSNRAIAWSTALQIAKRNLSVGLYKKPIHKKYIEIDLNMFIISLNYFKRGM